MLETVKTRQRVTEKGNVLFLILIAVALFAALSYAVTQSSRSGGGDANNETNLINSAQITQYPSSIRTAIIRMMVSNSIDPASLEFNPPSAFDDCTGASNPTPSFTQCVFHPEGGGATYVLGSADVSTGNAQQWVFNGENEVNLVGTTDDTNPTASTAEIIAILPNVTRNICERINEELGIRDSGGTVTVPLESGIDVTTQKIDGVAMVDGGPGGQIGGSTAPQELLNGQAFGCFQQPNGTYFYYHVLIEQ
jgi:hypothetical protein